MWGTARARAVPDAEPLGSATPSCVKEATTKVPGEGDEGGSYVRFQRGLSALKEPRREEQRSQGYSEF